MRVSERQLFKGEVPIFTRKGTCPMMNQACWLTSLIPKLQKCSLGMRLCTDYHDSDHVTVASCSREPTYIPFSSGIDTVCYRPANGGWGQPGGGVDDGIRCAKSA